MKRICLSLMFVAAMLLCSLIGIGRAEIDSDRANKLAEMIVKAMTQEQQFAALRGVGESVFGPVIRIVETYYSSPKKLTGIRTRAAVKYLGRSRAQVARDKAAEALKYLGGPPVGLARQKAAQALISSRKRWLKKTLWCRKDTLLRLHDKRKARHTQAPFVTRLSPVKVIDIVPSGNRDTPLRYILQTSSGEQGHLDLAITDFALWSRFFLEDQEKKYPDWSRKVWSAIKAGQVFLGMTKQQAAMSWGSPKSVNTTISAYGRHEQWVYSVPYHMYLYFEDGILTTIQK